MYYADDNLEAELNMGRDIKIQTEGNDSSSVASYELVFQHSVYLMEQWLSTVFLIGFFAFGNFSFLRSCNIPCLNALF